MGEELDVEFLLITEVLKGCQPTPYLLARLKKTVPRE